MSESAKQATAESNGAGDAGKDSAGKEVATTGDAATDAGFDDSTKRTGMCLSPCIE